MGDEVLKELAALMTKSLRSEDVLARYGGEEFAVVCRGLDLAKAQSLAERIREGDRGAHLASRPASASSP